MFKMRCGIPNAYILDITMYKMHVSFCHYCTIRILIFINKHNKVLSCFTDTSLHIYIRVKHFGMANIKFVASQAKTINLYKNTRSKLLKCWANLYFNKQCLVKKKKVIPKYANQKFTNNSPVSQITIKK